MSVTGPDGTLHSEGSLRALEHKSIRDFVQSAADDGYLSGRVLDYGCGKQPYRDIVEAAGGEYRGYDSAEFPANVGGPNPHALPSRPLLGKVPERPMTILCTQVIQYVPNEFFPETEEAAPHYISGPAQFLDHLRDLLYWHNARWLSGFDGHLVLTYPTNWPEVESADLHRFTKAGMERLLTEASFTILRHEPRAHVQTGIILGDSWRMVPDTLALGYGVIAQA